jgi:hypothetical protein
MNIAGAGAEGRREGKHCKDDEQAAARDNAGEREAGRDAEKAPHGRIGQHDDPAGQASAPMSTQICASTSHW